MSAAVKAAIAVLLNPNARKAIGWVVAAILSPLILLAAFLCCLGSGTAQHNNAMMDYCFYGTGDGGEIPAAFQAQMTAMRTAFTALDSAVASVNSMAEDGGLDPIQVKAVYYVLCSGGADTESFVDCFYTTEERTRTADPSEAEGEEEPEEETYLVAVPCPLNTAYAGLAALLGREITAEERENIQEVYTRIAGSGGEGYDGFCLRGSDRSIELEISAFTDPSTKNARDLTAYAVHAWDSGWGYVWGTYGDVLTESVLACKLRQYPEGVGKYESFIRANWLNGRTTDCVGLIKGYAWLDPDDLKIKYGTNGMPDIGANAMYHNAAVKGPIGSMPDTPGLAVWMNGHIGVYVGGGEVVEASGTKKGVVKTRLEGRGWTHWLEIPYINYN